MRMLLLFALLSELALAKASKGEAKEPAAEAAKPLYSDGYVHQWLAIPDFKAKSVWNEGIFSFTPKRGEVSVVVILASWCVPCQTMMPALQELEASYRSRFTRFVYVHSHDTRKDAKGFAQTYKLGEQVVIADHEVLAKFRQIEIPAIFVGDRHGWLSYFAQQAGKKELLEMSQLLQKITAY